MNGLNFITLSIFKQTLISTTFISLLRYWWSFKYEFWAIEEVHNGIILTNYHGLSRIYLGLCHGIMTLWQILFKLHFQHADCWLFCIEYYRILIPEGQKKFINLLSPPFHHCCKLDNTIPFKSYDMLRPRHLASKFLLIDHIFVWS